MIGKNGSNGCETKWRPVVGSGLFGVPGVKSGRRWRMRKGRGTHNKLGIYSLERIGNKLEEVSR